MYDFTLSDGGDNREAYDGPGMHEIVGQPCVLLLLS